MIFALDATLSRQPTWDIACELQADMFRGAAAIGGLDIQLVYYRGKGECCASRWISDGRTLADFMGTIDCRGGQTQIRKVLAHARRECERQKVQALVFVGDALEEVPSDLYAVASKLGVPCFMFQEGDDPWVTRVFQEIARLTKGAHCRFCPGAARELSQLLRAVAVYATGGLKALSSSQNAGALNLLQQLK